MDGQIIRRCIKFSKSKQHKKLKLNFNKLKQIVVRPKIKDGKLLFDRNNSDHVYIVEDDNEK